MGGSCALYVIGYSIFYYATKVRDIIALYPSSLIQKFLKMDIFVFVWVCIHT